MGAGVNEKQVGGMLARPSPLTQYLPHEYAIVVSSERQAVATADIEGEELAYLRGGPMPTSTTIGARPAPRRGLSRLLADCGIPGAFIIDAAGACNRFGSACQS
jgi:hypothetical protein